MKRRVPIGIAVVAALAVVSPPFARRFRSDTLTPSELAAKLPTPPDDSCDQIERALAKLPTEKLVRNRNPLNADEVAIYNNILDLWNSDSRSLLNVSNRTVPMDRDLSDCGCLNGIQLQHIADATHSFHPLAREILNRRNIRLVDPDTQALLIRSNDPSHFIREGESVGTAVNRAFSSGLFSMSEIVLDNEHRRALVGYSFVCGPLCGSGGVWMFEKVDGVWKKSEHACGGWVS
jgi:hypothetical protein